MASSSTLPSSLTEADSPFHRRWTYDVFLSFRGEETRKTFVGHLYEALDGKGINVFKDDVGLPRGESIAPKLLEAIEQSELAIIVFSKDYGGSSWCLDELVKIMECRKKLGQVVLPVFYDVEPADVRKQTGEFGKAFSKHSSDFNVKIWEKALIKAAGIAGINNTAFSKHSSDSKVEIWRSALLEAANIAGINNTAYRSEARCINEIVETISLKFRQTNSTIDDKLVGLDSRVKKVVSSLELDSGGVRVMGIWGMGGAGKTTLARAVFNKISSCFDGGICFLENVREACQKFGLVHAQGKILSSILRGKYKLNDVHHGKSMISRRLCRKNVLIVLDDVVHLSQLQALVGSLGWFGAGSRILITTRDEHLLLAHEVNEILHVTLLNDKEAIELFSRYAFGTRHPTLGYEELSHRVVCYANGLPLALKILGSSLCDKGMAEWESALARLPDDPETEIFDVLKISYDGLKPTEKEIFLDIACFFKGWEVHIAMRILNCCGFYPDIGVKVLIQKSLLTITTDETFEMHDLVQELGRHIVRGQHPKNPLKHSRVWKTDDLTKIYSDDEKVANEMIEALVENAQDDAYEVKEANNWGKVMFGKSFDYMKNLRLLHVEINHEGPDYLSNELRWLTWIHYPSRCLPPSFQAQNLVSLQIHWGNRLVQLWEGEKHLPELKFLDLSYCHNLIMTPNFKGIPKLEMLDLQNCSELVEIHSSIGSLESLVYVNLFGCKKLETFPSIVSMKSLETLIFAHCKRFAKFPEVKGVTERLIKLDLSGTAIRGLPSSIQNFTGLVTIDLEDCSSLTSLPDTSTMLRCLKKLNLCGCSNLEKLPEDLGQMESLEELLLYGTRISQLPFSTILLKNLKTLWCTNMDVIAVNSRQFLLHDLTKLRSLVMLDFSYCNLIEGDIPGDIGMLSSLENLILSGNHFCSLPSSLSQLSRLKMFVLDNCRNLQALPMLPSSIGILRANRCSSLRSLEGAPIECEWLWKVSFAHCSELIKDKEISVVVDRLIQAMLKGNASANHHFSILLSGSDIAVRLFQPVKGPEFVLKLPPAEDGEISGIAMCAVFPHIILGMNITVKVEPAKEAKGGLSYSMPFADQSLPLCTKTTHFWFGYMSSSLFRYTDWFQLSSSLLFSFWHYGFAADMCWVSPVYKKNKKAREILEFSHCGENSKRCMAEDVEYVECMNILTSAHNDGMNDDNSVTFEFGTYRCPPSEKW